MCWEALSGHTARLEGSVFEKTKQRSRDSVSSLVRSRSLTTWQVEELVMQRVCKLVFTFVSLTLTNLCPKWWRVQKHELSCCMRRLCSVDCCNYVCMYFRYRQDKDLQSCLGLERLCRKVRRHWGIGCSVMMGPITANDTLGRRKNNTAHTHTDTSNYNGLWSDLTQIINDCKWTPLCYLMYVCDPHPLVIPRLKCDPPNQKVQ